MSRYFEPYPGKISPVYTPPEPEPYTAIETPRRMPPDLVGSEHVDWRDVNGIAERVQVLEDEAAWLTTGADPGERFRFKTGDDHPTWDTGERINPRDHGAVGDGVADDTGPIADAFAQSETSGVPVFLPTGTYLTDTLNYRGQSIIGSHMERCLLRGKPGQDVLHLDPALGQFARSKGVWRDFTLEVDDSLDASPSFPTRGGVGNAGFAVDFNDAAGPQPLNMTDWVFEHVAAKGKGNVIGGQNQAAGWYLQGQTIVQDHIKSAYFGYLVYGWRDHNPQLNPTASSLSRDHITVDFIHFLRCAYPWRMINWGFCPIGNVIFHGPGTVKALEMAGVASGIYSPQIHDISFDSIELAGASASGITCDSSGYNIKVLNSSVAGTPPMVWDAKASSFEHFSLGGITGNPATILTINGHRNRFELFGGSGGASGTYLYDSVQDNGIGNQVSLNHVSGPLTTRPHRRMALTPDGRTGHQRDSIGPLLGHVTPPFVSGNDLLINPRTIALAAGAEGTEFSYLADPSADFGIVLRLLNGGGYTQDGYINGINGFRVGAFLPPSRVRVYVKFKAAVAGQQDWGLNAPAGTSKGTGRLAVATTYSVASFDADLSGVAVDTPLQLSFNPPISGGTPPVDIAWIMFRPWFGDLLSAGPVDIQRPSVNDVALSARQVGDVQQRFYAAANGFLNWGPGTGATDVQLSRAQADVLATAAGDQFACGGSLYSTKATTQSANYTATKTDYYIRMTNTGTATVTLPAAGGLFEGFELIVKRLGTADVILDGNASETIDGALTQTISQPNAVVRLRHVGTGWETLATGGILFNVRNFGVTGNGTTDDTAAIQAVIDLCNGAGGGTVYFPAGTYLLKTWLLLKSNVRLLGEGGTSVLYNDKTNATVDKRACVLVGNHHPVNMATQTSYALNTVTSGDAIITATTAGDTANFAVGELAIVGSATNLSGVSRHAQLNKIMAIAGGVITLKDPIEQTISDPKIWKINGTDISTSTAIYAVENVSVEKLGFKGRSGIATKGCMYGATFRDLVMLDVAIFFGTNMMTHVLAENISGQYCGRYLEYAMNSYDVTSRNIKGRFTPPAGLQSGEVQSLPIHMGEQGFRFFFEDVQCHLDPRFTLASELMQVKGSEIVFYRCDFRHGGPAGSYLLNILDCAYAGFAYDHIVFEECNFAAPNKARIVIIGGTATGAINPREIHFKGGQLLEPVTSDSIFFQACASSVCAIRDRTGKTINVRFTSKYPNLNGYRRS